MKIDMGLRGHDLRTLGGEAAAYERLGIDGLWSYETAHDPFLPLLAAAATTTRGMAASPLCHSVSITGPAHSNMPHLRQTKSPL